MTALTLILRLGFSKVLLVVVALLYADQQFNSVIDDRYISGVRMQYLAHSDSASSENIRLPEPLSCNEQNDVYVTFVQE